MYEFKVITLGDTFVGKTAIFRRYVYNIFDTNTEVTIGMNISIKEITLKNNKKIKIRLVDTAGTEKYKSLSKQYFKNTDVVLFVFALNNLDSFENILNWMNLFENCNNRINFIKYLIGNKNDLKQIVKQNQINEFLNNKNFFGYKSISAKNDDDNSINELFQEIGEELYKNYEKYGKNEKKNIKLSTYKEEKSGGCRSYFI